MGSLSGQRILPMKAVAGELPEADGDWAYEIKWDGMRIIAFCDEDGVRLASSNANDATASFPELQGLTDVLTGFESIILDGEVVAFGGDGLPKFSALQHRMHVKDPVQAAAKAVEVPVTFAVFDLLGLNGKDTRGLSLSDRRKLLEGIIETGSHWRLTDQTYEEPVEMLRTVTERGMEGIVAKRLSSTYKTGKRDAAWVKVKPTLRQEFIVCGWTEGLEGLSGGLGSLVLGVMDEVGGSRLIPTGTAGSGLSDKSRSWWQTQLIEDAVDESPFSEPASYLGRVVHWCQPVHVVEVAFGDWTDEGRLRHPVYLGRRNDKDPADVVREVVFRQP